MSGEGVLPSAPGGALSRKDMFAEWLHARRRSMLMTPSGVAARMNGLISGGYIEAIERSVYDVIDVPTPILSRLHGLFGSLPAELQIDEDEIEPLVGESPATNLSPASAPAASPERLAAGAPLPVLLVKDLAGYAVCLPLPDGAIETGHITFSPDAARAFAQDLIKHADLASA